MQHRALLAAAAAFAACFGTPLRAATVVEYYHAQLDHDFITPLADEIAALDSGRVAGWLRTGLAFDYGMRNDTPDPATLLVDAWLATSSDGVTWSERHVEGPFDFNTAPVADSGLFIGDYQGLASANGEFAAFFARTNTDLANRTDVFAAVFGATTTLAQAESTYRAAVAPPLAMTAELQERWHQSIRRTLRGRLVGSAAPAPGR